MKKIVSLGLPGQRPVPCHITGELTRMGDKLCVTAELPGSAVNR
jgi:hypothetical protein